MFETTGEKIRKKRTEASLTQAELAKRMGIQTKSGVCRLEKGNWHPSFEVVERAAKALGCSSFELIDLTSENSIEDNLVTLICELTDEQKERLLEYGNHLKSQDLS